MERAYLKDEAKHKLKGNVIQMFFTIMGFSIILCLFIYAPKILQILRILPNMTVINIAIYIVSFILALAFSYGMFAYSLTVAEYGERDTSDMFILFKHGFNAFILNIATYFLMSIIIFMWSLLFFIPGIIKAYAYSQVFYIRAENPDMGIMESLQESEKMMEGHKMEFFVLQLSFIPNYILVSFTFGIYMVYLIPYMIVTNELFILV